MLFSILNFFFTAIIIILFVRYFVEKYRYYGFGPIMIAIITLTESFLRPIRKIAPQKVGLLTEHLPLAAIGIALLIRGLVIWLIGAGSTSVMARIHETAGSISLLHALAVSFGMGMLLVTEMLVAFLFASLMISRRGITMGGNAGFMCFQERTFAIFQFMQKWIKSNNLIALFLSSATIILLMGAFSASCLSLAFIYGSNSFSITFIDCIFEICLTLIQTYWMVLLLAILSSWVGADHFSMMVQILRSLSDPYLVFFQRLLPWARIDFIDLSPIIAFLCLNPGLVYLLMSIRMSILRQIMSTMIVI